MEKYKELHKEWNMILTRLWDAYGKEVNPKQFKVYKKRLEDIPLGILEHVVDETISRHKYFTVPTLGEVLGVLKELHPDYKNEPAFGYSTPFRNEYEKNKPHHSVEEMKKSWRSLAINMDV